MTKKVGPEQEEILSALEVARDKLMVVREQEDEAMREVHELLREGFRRDVSGIKLSKASGLSQPRVYQVKHASTEEGDVATSASETSDD